MRTSAKRTPELDSSNLPSEEEEGYYLPRELNTLRFLPFLIDEFFLSILRINFP